jgi:hypothetical protein
MRTLSVSLALLLLTGLGVVFHQPTTGHAEAARTQPVKASEPAAPPTAIPTALPVLEMSEAEIARLLLQRAVRASEDPTKYEHALSYCRAVLALESVAGGSESFALARQQYDRLLAQRNPPKGQVHVLAAKIESTPAPRVQQTLIRQPLPVSEPKAPSTSARIISVGPDGLVYDEEP